MCICTSHMECVHKLRTAWTVPLWATDPSHVLAPFWAAAKQCAYIDWRQDLEGDRFQKSAISIDIPWYIMIPSWYLGHTLTDLTPQPVQRMLRSGKRDIWLKEITGLCAFPVISWKLTAHLYEPSLDSTSFGYVNWNLFVLQMLAHRSRITTIGCTFLARMEESSDRTYGRSWKKPLYPNTCPLCFAVEALRISKSTQRPGTPSSKFFASPKISTSLFF